CSLIRSQYRFLRHSSSCNPTKLHISQNCVQTSQALDTDGLLTTLSEPRCSYKDASLHSEDDFKPPRYDFLSRQGGYARSAHPCHRSDRGCIGYFRRCILPRKRASAIDPVNALRTD